MSTPSETESPERDTIWPLLGWVIFTFAVAVLAVAVFVGATMRAVVLDVVSFWPAWIVALVAAGALWPLHRRGIARVGAVAPLLLFSWVTGAVGLHYSGWDQLPSASGDLAGPAVGAAETAELSVQVSGDLVLVPGAVQLYEVELMRAGGTSGPAEALERRTDTNVVVELMERPDAGWFESRGWDVTISRTPRWALVLEADIVDVDLATVAIESLDVVSDGEIRLAGPLGEVPVMVNGSVTMRIPATAGVTVVGSADVPDGWVATDDGWTKAGDGTSSYFITVVSGASLTIEEW